MRVVFLKDVAKVADAGEIQEVANGFARNYLIPQGLAAQATADQLKRIEKIKKAAESQRLKELKDVEELARRLEGVTVNLKGKVAPSGKYYGAITSVQIAEELGKLTERAIERRLVEMPEPIHAPGAYTAVVRLHPQVASTINVVAEAEE